MDFASKMQEMIREIRDLKTSQLIASNSRASVATGEIPINIPAGSNTWTITYADDGATAPLVDIPNAPYYRLAILDYDAINHTQKIQLYSREAEQRSQAEQFLIITSREIQSVVRDF